jgi:hypothetical protein
VLQHVLAERDLPPRGDGQCGHDKFLAEFSWLEI